MNFFSSVKSSSLLLVSAALLSVGAFSCLEFKKEKAGAGSRGQLDASYASLRDNVFVPKCLSCHAGPSSPHGVDLSSYASIVHSQVFPPLIIPGSPETSSLFKSCMSGKMPKNSPHLPEEVMGALHEWIKNGAKEIEDVTPTPSPGPSTEPEEPGEPGEPGEDTTVESKGEPCDGGKVKNEPGNKECSSEPQDD